MKPLTLIHLLYCEGISCPPDEPVANIYEHGLVHSVIHATTGAIS